MTPKWGSQASPGEEAVLCELVPAANPGRSPTVRYISSPALLSPPGATRIAAPAPPLASSQPFTSPPHWAQGARKRAVPCSMPHTPQPAAARTCLVRMPGPVNLFLLAAGADLANADIGTLFDVMDDQTVQAATANAPVAGRLLQIEAARLGWFDLTTRN